MAETDDTNRISEYLVHIARLGLAGRSEDIRMYLQRIMKKLGKSDRSLSESLSLLLADRTPSAGALRDATGFVPVDADTRLALLRQEFPVVLGTEPILQVDVSDQINQVIAERLNVGQLAERGLSPTRSILFSGPPGVGKTMSAKWIANRLDVPLLILDLATVMSSFLGKTGSNIRSVLDYAKTINCVLLLDELDAIAKKRDDEGDVGELKRLVTVLLQEIDEWPSTSLLIAATNHSELLDPAIWRRFDEIILFPLPNRDLRREVIISAFGDDAVNLEQLLPLLIDLWSGQSNSDIVRTANWVRRRAALGQCTLEQALLDAVGRVIRQMPASDKKRAISLLADSSLSDRRISAATGISRDTLRKYRAGSNEPDYSNEDDD